MQHADGMVAHGHVDAPERAPGAPDRVEITSASTEQLGVGEALSDRFADAAVVEFAFLGEAQWTKGKCFAATRSALWRDLDEFEASAAKVADNAPSVRRAGTDAERREACFVRAIENTKRNAGFRFDLFGERAPIFCFAHGCRADGEDALHVACFKQQRETAQRMCSGVNACWGELASPQQVASKPCH